MVGRQISRREQIALFLHRGLDRWLSPLGVRVYRRTQGGITKPWRVDALLLTTRGRRSGRTRTVVLAAAGRTIPILRLVPAAGTGSGGGGRPADEPPR